MADWQHHEWKLLIGGELVAGAAGTAPIVNPATEEVVGEAPEASVDAGRRRPPAPRRRRSPRGRPRRPAERAALLTRGRRPAR